nr:lipoprotein [Bacterioplanes sanyensis]
MLTRLLLLCLSSLALTQLSGCGQKGDLYLPEHTPPPATESQS